MIVGKKGVWGCEIIEVCSILVNGFIMAKVFHSNNAESSSRIEKVNINDIDFII